MCCPPPPRAGEEASVASRRGRWRGPFHRTSSLPTLRVGLLSIAGGRRPPMPPPPQMRGRIIYSSLLSVWKEATMNPVLRLCEDVFADHGAMELPALPRMIFVVHGSIGIGDRKFRDDEAFGGESAVMLTAGSEGATVWRWELITREADFGRPPPGSGVASHEKLAAVLETIPNGALLLRGDSVAFPPGGCAYLHRHQGPGIRCLI